MSRTGRAPVLVVDDRRENLVALEAILQGLAVEAVSVSSGEDALKALMKRDFAVILLDAQMPGMDGFEAATHIKAAKRTQHVPIIFLTAADRDAHLAFRGYAAGAVDYITKPFDPWVLRAKVSVFVELWNAHDAHAGLADAALAAAATLRAAEGTADAATLQAAVTEALAALTRALP
ncbi:MAG: response regulator [Sporichthyaceae bacterium]